MDKDTNPVRIYYVIWINIIFSSTFSSPYIQDFTVAVTGNRLNITVGNTTIAFPITVPVTGNQINLANSPVSVISWNPIPPGVNQVWVPIDPDA